MTYRHAAYVRALVEAMPPLTSGQRARLAALLRPSPARTARTANKGGAAGESA